MMRTLMAPASSVSPGSSLKVPFLSDQTRPDKRTSLSVSCLLPQPPRIARDGNALSAEIVQLLRKPPSLPPSPPFPGEVH